MYLKSSNTTTHSPNQGFLFISIYCKTFLDKASSTSPHFSTVLIYFSLLLSCDKFAAHTWADLSLFPAQPPVAPQSLTLTNHFPLCTTWNTLTMCQLCWHSSFRLWKWTTGQSEAPDRLPASPPHLTASFCKHFVCFRICTSADMKAGSQEENQTNRRGLTLQIKINTNKDLEAARYSSELYKAVFVNGITAWLKTRSSSTKTWHTWCNKLLQST